MAGLAMVCLPSLAHANLIVNGSFEDPEIESSWQVYDGISSTIPGWTVTFGPGIEIQNNTIATPSHGNQLAELDSYGNSGIQQVIATDPGFYSFSFEYFPRPGVPDTSNGIEVYFNGSLLDSVSAEYSSDTVWTLHKYLLSTGSTTTIEFRAVGDSDALGGYLDNVQLITAIPEPVHTASLVGLGLGILALRRGLRRRS